MDSLNVCVLGGRSLVRQLLPQGWLAHVVDHIPRCMLKSEEKVTRAPTSQQSAGQHDVASGEVIRNNDVGGAGVCMVVISLSRLCQTPPQNLAVRGRVYGFIRRCIISPNAVVNSSTSHNIMQGLQSAGNLLASAPRNGGARPVSKHDTTSKHSYTWSHCTSRVEQLRGGAVLAIRKYNKNRVLRYTAGVNDHLNAARPAIRDVGNVQASRVSLSSLTCIQNT